MKMSEQYKGREHSGIKHYLLETYLETLFMIIGQHERRICYVDCFSGPWQESDESLSGTSIALSLEVMQKCRNSLRKMKKHVDFRALFVEKVKQSYQKLDTFLSKNVWKGIERLQNWASFINFDLRFLSGAEKETLFSSL